jgi:signal transduction histidine kinase
VTGVQTCALPIYGRSSGGLGLIIVKRILSLHDSVIRLEEREGAGAVFSFALPAAG